MRLFDLIKIMNPEVTPEKSKIHLAGWTGEDDPLAEYYAGTFNEWQGWQSKKNFNRKYLVSLISLRAADRWLFAGVYHPRGVTKKQGGKYFKYTLDEDESCAEMGGRIVASFSRSFRQSYLIGENWADQFTVSEFRPERLTIGDFPGFKSVSLSKSELDLIVRQSLDSWRTALSNVAGVYLISDTKTGGLYVGSASGEGGIWQRWSEYSATGHGGNVELRKLLGKEMVERSKDLHFAILEIADVHASKEEILGRESHWKDILLTRTHGLNAN